MEGYEMDNVTYYKELYRYFLDIKNNVKCNQCKMFPCVTIKNMLSRTDKLMLLTGSKNENTLNFYRRAGYNSEDKTAFIQWLE
jgi:hypothetical protein